MTVLIGYLPNAEGDAAFSAALTEVSRRNEDLVLLNSPRDGAFVSAEKAAPERIGNLIAEAEWIGRTKREIRGSASYPCSCFRMAREGKQGLDDVAQPGFRQLRAPGAVASGVNQ